MRKALYTAAGAAVAIAGPVGLAAPAAAHTSANATEIGHTAYITKPITGYQHPDNRSAPFFTNLTPGQEVTVVCFTEGQQLNGNHYFFRTAQSPLPASARGEGSSDGDASTAPSTAPAPVHGLAPPPIHADRKGRRPRIDSLPVGPGEPHRYSQPLRLNTIYRTAARTTMISSEAMKPASVPNPG